MTDILTPEQRHKNMCAVRSKDTKIELILRKALWHKGYRYRKNYALLPGKPDIVLTRFRIVVFCDSEFFHGYNWNTLKEKLGFCANGNFWKAKISRNMERDKENNRKLEQMGWVVLRFWGRDIKKNTEGCVNLIEESIIDYLSATTATDNLDD